MCWLAGGLKKRIICGGVLICFGMTLGVDDALIAYCEQITLIYFIFIFDLQVACSQLS